MLKRNLLLVTAATLAVTGSAAHAETMTMEEMQAQLTQLSKQVSGLTALVEEQGRLIQAQKTQLEQQEEQLQEQAGQVSAQSAVIGKITAIEPAAGDAKADTGDGVKISMKPSPKIESADGKYSFQPFGRVHFDVTHFEDDNRDHPDNAHFRRARMGFKGNLGEDFNYKIEVDFAGEGVNFKETYLGYTGFGATELLLGHTKPPPGMEQNTSSNYIWFLERAPVTNAFTRAEQLGFAFESGGNDWSLSGGIYNEDAGNNNANDDEGWSLDARGSLDLLRDSPHVLHVGAGGSVRTPNAAMETVTLSARPAGTGNNVVSTGALANVDRAAVWGGEVAGVFGPFSFQGEYLRHAVERDAGTDPEFDGWYGQASYFLTGETRPYDGGTGNFGRVKPATPFSLGDGGWGAWEVVARYDTLDLNDSGVTGGELTDWTVGVNWYLTGHIRMMLNYVDVNTDNNAVVANDDPQIVSLRTQWDF